jgi:hypothetical protein
MRDSKLKWIVDNGKACVAFLDGMAKGDIQSISENAVLNHGLSVHALIDALVSVEMERRKVQDQLDGCAKELRLIKQKEIDPILSKRFEELKDSLISYIEDF